MSRRLLLAAIASFTPLLGACGSSGSPSTGGDAGPRADAGKDSATKEGGSSRDAGKDASKDAARTTDGAEADGHGDAPSQADAGDSSAAHDSGEDTGTTSHDAGAGDAGFTPGMPITATAGAWSWVPFPDAVCANGTATGIGINPSSTPGAPLMIYLEGGGACWSDLTCYTVMSAANFTTGYGESNFTAESTSTSYLAEPGGFFDRTAAANPLKDYSYVYVPYCTGDVHGGNNVVQFGANTARFVGWKNFGAYLDRVVPTFPSASRVILAGSSAGGFGAAINWWRTQQAFGSIRVDLLDDSGTAMPAAIEASGTAQSTFAVPWNLAATLPPGCTACGTDLSSLYGFYDSVFASHRGALLSYTQDSVLPSFFGITTAEFTAGLNQDLGAYFKTTDPLKSFVIGASGHVLFFSPTLATSGGVTVQQFVTQMVTDAPTWASAGP